MPSVSPQDGSVMGWYPVVQPASVRPTLETVRGQGSEWATTPLRSRLQVLRRLREVLAGSAEHLAWTLCRETGKPIVEVFAAEIIPVLKHLEWLEREAPGLLAPERLRRRPSARTLEWEPYGVIGLVSPWNYPLFLTLPVIASALAAGNAVLWKPSELALASAHELYDVLLTAGLGRLVGMLPGDAIVGEAVVEAGCDKYVFIGSPGNGRQVLERLGRQLKPAVAELSGCDPMIVCPDADLETAAAAAVRGRLTGAGQTCMAPKRLYVHRSVYARFLELAAERMHTLNMGDPRDPHTDLGPVRTEELRDAAIRAVDEAVDGGAFLICGGQPMPGPGFYLRPALLGDCREDMRVFHEDLFAPVLAVCPVNSVDEAIRRANNSPFGLTASVWTSDRRKGLEIARWLRGGVVCVNDVIAPAAEPDTPFGGSGESGYGRTRGAAGLREMVRSRVVDGGPPSRLSPWRNGASGTLHAIMARQAASGWLRKTRTLNRLLDAVRRYGRRHSG